MPLVLHPTPDYIIFLFHFASGRRLLFDRVPFCTNHTLYALRKVTAQLINIEVVVGVLTDATKRRLDSKFGRGTNGTAARGTWAEVTLLVCL